MDNAVDRLERTPQRIVGVVGVMLKETGDVIVVGVGGGGAEVSKHQTNVETLGQSVDVCGVDDAGNTGNKGMRGHHTGKDHGDILGEFAGRDGLRRSAAPNVDHFLGDLDGRRWETKAVGWGMRCWQWDRHDDGSRGNSPGHSSRIVCRSESETERIGLKTRVLESLVSGDDVSILIG